MKTGTCKQTLALLCAFWLTFGFAGCNQEAEVPTAGDGPKQSASEDSTAEKKNDEETKADEKSETNEPAELKDDSTESESGSILE